MTQNAQTAHIAVIGMGIMGQGIAEVFATAGHKVVVFDMREGQAAAAIDRIKTRLEALLLKNKLNQTDCANILARLEIAQDMDFQRFDLVIEVIIEDLAAKQDLFGIIEKTASPACVLCSNTSSLSINQISENLRFAERFAGLHFFNPATFMPLVEIVQGKFTHISTIDYLTNICRQAGKKTVLVADSPGFIVNRVARPYYTEALWAVENTDISISQADMLLEGLGFRMGPFRLMDLIGNDINLAVTTSLYNAIGQPTRFKPSPIQAEKVESGELGQKSGKGFYNYTH